MHQEKITAIFDQQAASYDQRWSRLAPINNTLHLLTTAILSELPPQARILCVGAGTGAEILHLAAKFPQWHFTAVEPSAAMLDVLKSRAEEQGISSRCVFHTGYLDSLPPGEAFDAATAFLVSQFILDRDERAKFFLGISKRLRPNGLLISSDLAGDLTLNHESPSLLEIWHRLTSDVGTIPSPESIEKLRQTYTQDVAVLTPAATREIIQLGGFDSPVLFYQAGMIHAWYSKRSPDRID